MAFLIDSVFDNGLSTITSSATRLDINYGTEPTTYGEATNTKSCGNDTVTPSSPANGSPSGRAVTIPAITAGAVTASQTAAWWSLTDGTSSLIATGPLTSTQAVVSGNTFTLDAITITIIDAAAV